MPVLSTKNLTETRIKRLKVEDTTRTYWDSETRGFGLQITSHGTKTLYFKFIAPRVKLPKTPDGPMPPTKSEQAWMNLGRYEGAESLEAARKRAKHYRDLLNNGKDPRAEVLKAQSVPTLGAFIKTYMELMAERKNQDKLRQSSYNAIETMLEDLVGPVLGQLRINEIEGFHILNLRRDIARGWRPGMKKSEKPKKPTPILANRMVAHLSALFAEAIEQGYRADNPCKGKVDHTVEKTKGRFLTKIERDWLWKVLEEAETWGAKEGDDVAPTAYALAAMKLLIYTGARLNEILRLRWDQVDLERRVITLERHKTSGKVGAVLKGLPLPAVAILKALQDRPGKHLGSPFVIQGHKHKAPMVNLSKAWIRIKQAITKASEGAVNIEDMRIHDIRHNFATTGRASNATLPQLQAALGHSQPGTTNRYFEEDLTGLLETVDGIAAILAPTQSA